MLKKKKIWPNQKLKKKEKEKEKKPTSQIRSHFEVPEVRTQHMNLGGTQFTCNTHLPGLGTLSSTLGTMGPSSLEITEPRRASLGRTIHHPLM